MYSALNKWGLWGWWEGGKNWLPPVGGLAVQKNMALWATCVVWNCLFCWFIWELCMLSLDSASCLLLCFLEFPVWTSVHISHGARILSSLFSAAAPGVLWLTKKQDFVFFLDGVSVVSCWIHPVQLALDVKNSLLCPDRTQGDYSRYSFKDLPGI